MAPPVAPLVVARVPEPGAVRSSTDPQAEAAAAPPRQGKAAVVAPPAADSAHSVERGGSLPTQPRRIEAGGPSSAGVLQGKQAPGEGALGPFGPRGFENGGNLCFANATLQALLGSSSFVQLLDNLHRSSHYADVSASSGSHVGCRVSCPACHGHPSGSRFDACQGSSMYGCRLVNPCCHQQACSRVCLEQSRTRGTS